MHKASFQAVVQDMKEFKKDLYGNVIEQQQLKFYMKQCRFINTAQHNDWFD